MTEAIRIQKDVPVTNLFPNPSVNRNWSQRNQASSQLPIKSQTSKRKLLEPFINHQIVNAFQGGELAVEYLSSKYRKNLSVNAIRQTCHVALSFLLLHSQ